MAYLAFHELGGVAGHEPGGVAAGDGGSAVAPAGPAARFSALQWSVVMLAQRDPLWSIRAPGRARRLLRVLLGARNSMLADAALEALRRVAVLAWHRRDAQGEGDWAGFVAAGFGASHYQLLVARVAALAG